MSAFSPTSLLGELEQLVMLAVIRLDTDAYAVAVRDEIHRRTGLDLVRGSVYVTLDRLDRKGYLDSWFGDPTPERGGKAKRLFRVTAAGLRALRTAEATVSRMRHGLRLPAQGTSR